MPRKLKLTDKIRKFFGQNQKRLDDPLHGAESACLLASITSGSTGSAAGSVNGTPFHTVDCRRAESKAYGRSTFSQKAELSSNPQVHSQDEQYSLQTEIQLPQLIAALESGLPEQRAAAAEALFNYTADSETARQKAAASGVVEHLIDLLRTGNDHGKMYAAYTLSSLTSIEESLSQICALGAIQALVDVLAACPMLVCKKGAMRALGRLARNDDAAAEIVARGGLQPIVTLLTHEDSSLVRRCLIALYFIGADKDTLQQQIGATGAIPHLLKLCQSDSPDVQAESADVLKVLSRNAACGKALASLGGLDVLITVANAGLTSRAKASATRALQRLGDIPELKVQHLSRMALAAASNKMPDPALLSGAASGPSAIPAVQGTTGFSNGAAALSPPQQQQGGGPTRGNGTSVAAPAIAAAAEDEGASEAEAGERTEGDDEEGEEGDDVVQLVEVAQSGPTWIREKAVAAVAQAAAADPLVSK
jgi:hypothetical protein